MFENLLFCYPTTASLVYSHKPHRFQGSAGGNCCSLRFPTLSGPLPAFDQNHCSTPNTFAALFLTFFEEATVPVNPARVNTTVRKRASSASFYTNTPNQPLNHWPKSTFCRTITFPWNMRCLQRNCACRGCHSSQGPALQYYLVLSGTKARTFSVLFSHPYALPLSPMLSQNWNNRLGGGRQRLRAVVSVAGIWSLPAASKTKFLLRPPGPDTSFFF